jgi:hypothetical protein
MQEVMFNRRRAGIYKSCFRDLKGVPPSDEDKFSSRMRRMESDLGAHDTLHLGWIAHNYDIDLPDDGDGTMWDRSPEGSTLTAKGRTYLRKLIDEEKARRFELRVRWVKLLMPIIAALAGLVGALTGLVLALKK